jgi:hypothetical protein
LADKPIRAAEKFNLNHLSTARWRRDADSTSSVQSVFHLWLSIFSTLATSAGTSTPTLTTHDAGGLTKKDFDLAGKFDRLSLR